MNTVPFLDAQHEKDLLARKIRPVGQASSRRVIQRPVEFSNERHLVAVAQVRLLEKVDEDKPGLRGTFAGRAHLADLEREGGLGNPYSCYSKTSSYRITVRLDDLCRDSLYSELREWQKVLGPKFSLNDMCCDKLLEPCGLTDIIKEIRGK